jgi:quinol monooxygenase YgiN
VVAREEERVPYVHQIEVPVSPTQADDWRARARNHLSVMARREGLMSMRLYHDLARPERFLTIAVWRSRDDSQRALESREVALAPGGAAGGGGATAQTVREFELIDFVWGRRGPRAFLAVPGGFAQHLYTHVTAAKREAWEPYRRNFGSVMARQNGITSYEMMQDLADPEVVLVLRNYESGAYGSVIKGASSDYRPNREVQYATRPALEFNVYEGARPVEYTDCELVDGVVGPGGIEHYQQFMENLQPV